MDVAIVTGARHPQAGILEELLLSLDYSRQRKDFTVLISNNQIGNIYLFLIRALVLKVPLDDSPELGNLSRSERGEARGGILKQIELLWGLDGLCGCFPGNTWAFFYLRV